MCVIGFHHSMALFWRHALTLCAYADHVCRSVSVDRALLCIDVQLGASSMTCAQAGSGPVEFFANHTQRGGVQSCAGVVECSVSLSHYDAHGQPPME